jgi:hypothetical protein
MAKYVFFASTGYVGSSREETVEIPDEELEGMSENEQTAYVDKNYYQDWLAGNTELSFWKVDE